MAASDTSQPTEFLYDFLMEMFNSPTWQTPIMEFIDDNCIIFDNVSACSFSI